MTNNQVLGYVIATLDKLGYGLDDIEEVLHEMRSLFDELTPEEAEVRGDKVFNEDDGVTLEEVKDRN